MYRNPQTAPESQLAEERRGRVLGRYCRECSNFYPKFRARHSGKPLYGKDHVASPCSHEGDVFTEGEGWWEPAVEVLPPAQESGGSEGDEAAAG